LHFALNKKVKTFVRSARVGHLATSDKRGRPSIVPICYVFDGKDLYTPIDEKPKKKSPLQLKRIKNILANPEVSVVVDRYRENWKRLGYVLISGSATVLHGGAKHRKAVTLLRKKYPQYRQMAIHQRPIIRIALARWKSWGVM